VLSGVIDKVGWRLAAAYGAADRALDRTVLRWRYGFPRQVLRRIELGEVGLAGEGRNPYEPSPRVMLRRALRQEEVGENDVFIDLGSGMGQAVIEAARYPFRRLIGVELVPEFARMARALVARNRRRFKCNDIELVTADAADFEIPDDVTVAYMFNPFEGGVFAAVLENLLASIDRNPRIVRLVYAAPREADALMASGRVRFVRFGKSRIRRWRSADYIHVYELLPAGYNRCYI